jgi:hypothetical protein
MMFVSLNNNTTDVTSGAEATNPSQAPELIQVISGVRVFHIFDFWSDTNIISHKYITALCTANINEHHNQC